MSKISLYTLNLCLLVLALACGRATPAPTPTPTPNTQATIEAAVAATSTAQAGIQATVDAAVQATATTQATLPPESLPTPTLSAEYVTLTEEELAAMIDQAVAEAAAESHACSESTMEATADGTVTQEEVIIVEVHVTGAEEAIADAEALIAAYYELYGALGSETLALLKAVEQDLAAIAQNTADIAAALQEINTTLEEGLALAEESITQLEAAAQEARDLAVELQARSQAWQTNLQSAQENRVNAALSTTPENIPTDRLSAVQSAFDYVDAVRQSLDDDRLSAEELSNVAKLGANANAGLSAHGGPQLKRISDTINQTTEQLARGQVPQARANLGAMEDMLGSRPMPPRP